MRTSSIAKLSATVGLALATSLASAQWVPSGMPCNPNRFGPQHHHWQFNGQDCPNVACPNAREFRGKRGVPPCASQNYQRAPRLNFEERKALLLGSLDLNDSQKSAWKNYSNAVDQMHDKKRPNYKDGMSRQELLQERANVLKARLQNVENLIKARAELLKVLTPEQVSIFEKLETRGHRGFAKNRAPQAIPSSKEAPKAESKL